MVRDFFAKLDWFKVTKDLGFPVAICVILLYMMDRNTTVQYQQTSDDSTARIEMMKQLVAAQIDAAKTTAEGTKALAGSMILVERTVRDMAVIATKSEDSQKTVIKNQAEIISTAREASQTARATAKALAALVTLTEKMHDNPKPTPKPGGGT